MVSLKITFRILSLLAILVMLAGCQQQDAPQNQATRVAAEQAAQAASPVASAGADKLTVTVTGDHAGEAKGAWVHVRVVENGKSVAPSEGLCEGQCNPGMGWSQTDPGVYVYSFTPAVGPKTLTFMVDKAAKPTLVFSTTEVSGDVKVEWGGVIKTYDLYRPSGDTTEHKPIDLSQSLPEVY